MTDNAATTTTGQSENASKYTVGLASRQARLNKEAGHIRTRVHQLLDAVAKQQQQRRQQRSKKMTEEATSALTSPKGGPSTAAATLFMRKNSAVASLFSGSSSSSSTCSSSASSLNARHLRMNRPLTARDLVIEALLNIATRKAAPRFKADIRTHGGLDVVSEATIDAVDYLKDLIDSTSSFSAIAPSSSNKPNPTGLDDFALDNLKRVGYYAKMLENMTDMNPDNQTHLVRYKERALIDRLVMCIRLCGSRLPRHGPPSTARIDLDTREKLEQSVVSSDPQQQPSSTGEPEDAPSKAKGGLEGFGDSEYQQDQQTLLTCLLAIFRLFVNISHSEYASDRLGGCPGLLEATFDCLFHLPDRLPTSRRFDLLILVLCLLANLCEHCPENRIRIVHLEVPSAFDTYRPLSSSSFNKEANHVDCDEDEVEEEEDAIRVCRHLRKLSALDEVVELFLYREKKTLMHEFEQEDTEEKKEKREGEVDSTTTTSTGTLQRPKPPPSLLGSEDATGETIEEAGLKWRLIGGGKKPISGGGHGRPNSSSNHHLARGGASGNQSRLPSKRSRMLAKRRRRRQALLRGKTGGHNHQKQHHHDSSSEEDEEDEENEEEDLDSDIDDVEVGFGSDGSEDEEDDDDDDYGAEDDEMCGGADVEFVAETAEEQEKLKERMSSANQHMEDSVAAAHAALLLGCILQSSPRYAERIRSRLPNGKFRPLAIMLAKLLSFLSLTRGVESTSSDTILRIVRTLDAQDNPHAPSGETPSSSSTSSSADGALVPSTRSGLRRRPQL